MNIWALVVVLFLLLLFILVFTTMYFEYKIKLAEHIGKNSEWLTSEHEAGDIEKIDDKSENLKVPDCIRNKKGDH